MQLVIYLTIFNAPFMCHKIRCDEKSKKIYKFFDLNPMTQNTINNPNNQIVISSFRCRAFKAIINSDMSGLTDNDMCLHYE